MNYKEKTLLSQKDLKTISKNNLRIITKAHYGPSKPTTIPLILNKELAFFVAAIIGDGHIKKNKLQISFECTNLALISYLQEICKEIFKRKFNITKVKLREGKKPSSNLLIDSKAIYNLLTDVFEIPPGKKSNIVKVPEVIINSKKSIKIAFMKGIMATEGGKRKRGYGLSTASKKLWEDLIKIFEDIEIPVLKDKWTHKSYKKEYYGISFKERYIDSLMWECRSGQTGCA